jgi:hypothetical protein
MFEHAQIGGGGVPFREEREPAGLRHPEPVRLWDTTTSGSEPSGIPAQ